MILKRNFQVDEQCSFWKNYGECEKSWRSQLKLVTTKARSNYLVSESNYHKKKLFSDNLLAIEIKGIQITMNKFVYVSILRISKIVMYDFDIIM